MSQRELSGIGANPIRLIDATAGNETYQLPSNFAVNRSITVRRVPTDVSSNTVTITVASGQSLNGATNGTLTVTSGQEVRLVPTEAGSWLSFGSGIRPGIYPTTATLTDPQFKGAPKVMATPPTIVIGSNSNGATSMTNVRTLPGTSYTSILCDDLTKYTVLGSPGAPVKGSVGIQAFACYWPYTANIDSTVRLEFLFDGAELEFCIRQFGGVQFRIMVDGEYATQYPQTLGGTANVFGGIKVTFASAVVRRIVFEYKGAGAGFAGVWLKKTDTMRATAPPSRRLLIAGDSYTGGSGASTSLASWPIYYGLTLGFRDIVNAGIGGSGWIQTTNGFNMQNRVQSDVVAAAPTDVVYALGHNDTSSSNPAIAAAVDAVLNATRSGLPNLRSLIVTGAFFAGGSPGVYAAMNTAIKNACTPYGATFIETATNPIFTGTGNAGALAADGNSDLYISSDTVHPTDAGSAWLGYAMAQSVAAVVS